MDPFPFRRPLAARTAGRQRGVTLVELLVVLTILGISAAAVAPAFIPRPAAPVDDVSALARRLAIREASRVRLDVTDGGAWTLTRVSDAVVLASGTSSARSQAESMTVDAMGTCVPASVLTDVRPFDPLTCRPRLTAP